MLEENASGINLNQFLDAKTLKYLAESFEEIIDHPKSLLQKRNAARSSVIVKSNILVKAEQGKFYAKMMKHNSQQSYFIYPEEQNILGESLYNLVFF